MTKQNEKANNSAKLDLVKIDFETALEKLQVIVEDLEQGGLSLDKTLTEFSQGMQLLKFCHQKLDQAEKKIELMVKENDEFSKEVPFASEVEGE